jgi:YggT family protein
MAAGPALARACVPSRPTLGSALRFLNRRVTRNAMYSLLVLVDSVVQIFIWMLIVSAILSWLTAFGVVNRYNRVVSVVGDTLYRLTDPVLRPIRSILPNLGGVDVSPIVAILLLTFLRNLMFEFFSGRL